MAQDARTTHTGMKDRVVARWVHRRLSCISHEARVSTLAQRLFALLGPLHRMGRFERRMLRLGALVHDVGRAVSDRRHPQVGCEMILIDRYLPLNDTERRCLAYLTRHHRGAVPKVGYDDILKPTDPRRAMRAVLAILRAADALDGRQHEAPEVRFKLRDRKLKIRCHLPTDCPRARKFFNRRKKFGLLEELLGVKVDLATRESVAA